MAYEAFEYVNCFERAFEVPFNYIKFDTMDFDDVRPRLRLLAEYIDAYYEKAEYPTASSGEVIPYMVTDEEATSHPTFNYSQFKYTPPLWHQEARRALLFAHKIAFEDPLPQLLGPMMRMLEAKNFSHGGAFFFSSRVHPHDLEFLRTTLVNVQKMERLIRSGIVIPHNLLTARIPDYRDNYQNDPQFRDGTSLRYARDLANKLGALISQGQLDGFRLPSYIVRNAKKLAPQPEDWKRIAWFDEFFEEIAIHDKSLSGNDPMRLWSEHLYRMALYKRYLDSQAMGYAPHFLHKDGYQLYAIMEALDFATCVQANEGVPWLEDAKYAKNMGSDSVFISALDSFLRPKLDVLNDEDLVSIRLTEPLFEAWRATVRETLNVVRQCELNTGRAHPELAEQELRDRYNKWRADSKRQLKTGYLKDTFDVGKSTAVSIIGNIALHKATFGASLGISGVRKVLGAVHRTFTWRSDHKLYNRHFLSVL